MLVLTRKLQESIKIGDGVTVTILKVKGNTVRIGIEAPRDVRVVRAELPPNETSAENAPGAEAATTGPSLKVVREAITPPRREPASLAARTRRARLPMPPAVLSAATAK